jgi:glutathione gamma-glutamylcysteinyltransferase
MKTHLLTKLLLLQSNNNDVGLTRTRSQRFLGSTRRRMTSTTTKMTLAPTPSPSPDQKNKIEAQNPITTTASRPPSPPAVSFYRRPLPNSCVAFSSRQGRQRLANSLATNGLKSFFALMEQHVTQTEPAYCGLATLMMALNALAVDPLTTWKGPWRWYAEEHMVNCCLDLTRVQLHGVTLSVFAGIATCQGLSVQVTYADDDEEENDHGHEVDGQDDDDKDDDETNDESSSLARFRRAVELACVENDRDNQKNIGKDAVPLDHEEDTSLTAAAISLDTVLVVSYSRQVLGQTGTGHFSPIVAYDHITDSVLIADTARFKYGAHWVHLPLLFRAMRPIDPDTGRSRGYVLLQLPNVVGRRRTNEDDNEDRAVTPRPQSTLLRALGPLNNHPSRSAAHLRLQELVTATDHPQQQQEQQPVSFADFYRTFSSTSTDGSTGTGLPLIWQLVLPHVKPVSQDAARLAHVDRLRLLLDRLVRNELARVAPQSMTTTTTTATTATTVPSSSATTDVATTTNATATNNDNTTCRSSAPCHSKNCRIIPLGADQAIYLVYLAALGEKTQFLQTLDQANISATNDDDGNDTAELLWQEVLLLRQHLDLGKE